MTEDRSSAGVTNGAATMFGFEFSSLDLDSTASLILHHRREKREAMKLLVTANVDHVANIRRREALRSAYSRAWLRTADGFPVYLYGRLKGLAGVERVTGADLFAALWPAIATTGHRPFLVVPDHSTGDLLAARSSAPGNVRYAVPAFGFEHDGALSSELLDEIRAHETTHLFMGVGSPKSEEWADAHRCRLEGVLVCCFGAGLEYVAGTRKRAPAALRRMGAEWLWRVTADPKRLFRRYFIDSRYFIGAVLDDVRQREVA